MTESLGLDSEIAEALATSAEGEARALHAALQGNRSTLDFDALLARGQRPGRINIASLFDRDLPTLHCATLFTLAAVNWLLLDETRRARNCFITAAHLVEAVSADDSVVLTICANADTSALEFLAPDQLSPWVRELADAAHAATGADVSSDMSRRELLGESRVGIAVTELSEISNRMVAVNSGDSAGHEIRQIADELATMLERATIENVRLMSAPWWPDQSGQALPIDPNSLAIATIDANWRRRWKLIAESDERRSRRDLNNPIAKAARAVANRLSRFDVPGDT